MQFSENIKFKSFLYEGLICIPCCVQSEIHFIWYHWCEWCHKLYKATTSVNNSSACTPIPTYIADDVHMSLQDIGRMFVLVGERFCPNRGMELVLVQWQWWGWWFSTIAITITSAVLKTLDKHSANLSNFRSKIVSIWNFLLDTFQCQDHVEAHANKSHTETFFHIIIDIWLHFQSSRALVHQNTYQTFWE